LVSPSDPIMRYMCCIHNEGASSAISWWQRVTSRIAKGRIL